MAEQFLKRAKVGTAREEMRREAVPQRMRRKALGQTQPFPRCGDCTAHEVRVERTAANSEEQRSVSLDRPGALASIGFDRSTDRWHDRYDTRLRPFAGDPQRLADRPRASGERKRLRDAETGAVEQQQNGEVTGADPFLVRGFRGVLGEGNGFVRRHGPRQCPRPPRSAGPGQLRGLTLMLGDKAQEVANGGKLASRRRGPEPLAATLGKKRAQVLRTQGGKLGGAYGFGPIRPQESDEPVRRRDIGSRRVRGSPPVVQKMACPALDESAGGMIVQLSWSISHRRMIAARLRPRNISNSDP